MKDEIKSALNNMRWLVRQEDVLMLSTASYHRILDIIDMLESMSKEDGNVSDS